MSLGPVNQSTQMQRTREVDMKQDVPEPTTTPTTDPAAKPNAPLDVQNGAREMFQGREQQEIQIQEVRRRENCGRGRCTSVAPSRGLSNGKETMLA